jgi:GNAT superfamily N-acetyltransferase
VKPNELKFLEAVLGSDGAKALAKAVDRQPTLAAVIVPRAILSWLDYAASLEYEGGIPSIADSYVQFSKTEKGFNGAISLGDGLYDFEEASVYHLAASIAVALGVESQPLEADVRDTVLVRLGKSLDTLAKAQILMKELRASSTLSTPKTIAHYGGYHVEKDPASEKPYSVIHTLSKSTVQDEIETLKDAGQIAKYHQTRYGGTFSPSLNKKILDPKMGITFHHEHHDLGDGDMITHIKAVHPSGKVVGEAAMEYNKNNPGGGMKPDVHVHPNHRRQGIASAMYAHAQKITGLPVMPSSAQSQDAEALWAGNQSNPQFGKVELPGATHLPTEQKGPQAPQAPQKQPSMGQATQGPAPQKQPQAPQAPQKQPSMGQATQGPAPQKQPQASQQPSQKKKIPGLSIGKSEAEQPCFACGGKQFQDHKFHGCICYRSLNKSIRTTAYGDGYVLEFGPDIDVDTVKALIRTFRSRYD